MCATELISPSSNWHYLDKFSIPPENWHSKEFDDSNWSIGQSQFGYGEGDENTVTDFGDDPNNKPAIQLFRKAFTVKNLTTLGDLSLRLLVDDGALIFINGIELYRLNLPARGNEVQFATTSYIEHVWIELPLDKAILVNGINHIAVSVHQISKSSSDLSFDLAIVEEDQLND